MNNITVDLPIQDPITGKKKKATLRFFQINDNLEMKISRIVSFYEADGTPAQSPANSKLDYFEPIEVVGSTENNFVDPATGANLSPTFDENGLQTNNAVKELTFWQNIPLSQALPQLPQPVKDALDQANIKASDIIYGLIKQVLISDNLQGIY